jgi:hypothetical protein
MAKTKQKNSAILRVSSADHAMVMQEIARINKEKLTMYRETVETYFHQMVRNFVECRECGLVLNKCNCNNTSK